MRFMERTRVGLGIALVGITGMLVACSSGSCDETATATASKPSETSATRVDADMKEWSITVDPTSAKAGEVRFFAKNTGAVLHEFVVVKSDADPASLPVYGANDTPADSISPSDVT